MKLITSNYPPAVLPNKTFSEVFEGLISASDDIKIAAGYVSSEAIAEIEAIIKANFGRINNFQLVLGMHKFDGFSPQQYESSMRLHKFLTDNNIGGVNICTAFPYHGKVYLFSKEGKSLAGTVGSANLSAILDFHTLYETDLLIQEPETIQELSRLIGELWSRASKPLDELEDPLIKKSSVKPIDGVLHVEKVSTAEGKAIKDNRTGIDFEIPLKDTPKSNLNPYFGEGRLNTKTGFTRPRHWYEVELIVSKEITQKSGYPEKGKSFTVITDDGYKFECNVNGDNSKNFRSKYNLQILGRWIKGRLEEAGYLKVGEPVTKSILDSYGRQHIVLAQTKDAGIWFLDFSN